MTNVFIARSAIMFLWHLDAGDGRGGRDKIGVGGDSLERRTGVQGCCELPGQTGPIQLAGMGR